MNTTSKSTAALSPALSILVPIYNVEKYLRSCLDSLVAQSFTDFEVICLNDGSTDGSREIIQEYLDKDSRFRVIDKENSGYGASMNMGLAAARGTWLGILESDDFLDPRAFEVLHQTALENDAQVVKSNFFLYWSKPQERNELFALVTPSMTGHVVVPRLEPRIFYQKPSIWSGIYRMDFLKEHGIDFLETPGASYQDSGFNFKVWASAQRAVFIQDAFLHYRQDNEASSINSPGKVYCVCNEYAEMERWLSEQSDLSPEEKVSLDGIIQKMRYDTYMWNYERLVPELQQEWLQRVQEDFARLKEDGRLDESLFEPWKLKDLRLILANPQEFYERRAALAEYGRKGKALYYLKTGGPATMVQIARHKLADRK